MRLGPFGYNEGKADSRKRGGHRVWCEEGQDPAYQSPVVVFKASNFGVSLIETQLPPEAVEEEAGKNANHPVQFHTIWGSEKGLNKLIR